MPRCAFLTLEDPTGYVMDDDLAIAPLAKRGWQVETVPWNRPGVDWRRFERVILRSTWDYQDDPETFLAVLESIEASGVALDNPLDVVRWNLDKSYLRELAEQSVPTVPTHWLDRLAPGQLGGLFDRLDCDELVVKPVLGANAGDAFWLDRQSVAVRAAEVESVFANKPLLAQPLVRSVLTEGEVSLVYFWGKLSHAVLKTPKGGDFRVQEEHGGRITLHDPEPSLRTLGEQILAGLERPPLYARVDCVRSDDPATPWWLMELELIEPSLYLRLHPEAPARFADAVVARPEST